MAVARLPDTAPVAARERSLLDVLAATVATYGGRLALDAPDAALTYRELFDATCALAGRLRDRGMGPGDRVGVCVASGTAELYVSILGVLMAGAAYVPVDADDPPARAAAIWNAAGACAVVEDGFAISELRPPAGGDGPPALGDDAWVIFTSGSTGEPKGVAVSHRSAAAFVDAEAGLFRVRPDDRVLAGLSVGFDASCEEMWLAWRSGAALVPAPRALVRSGADLGPWLAERGITVVSTVPTLASMWDSELLRGVRLLILGGEACPESLAWRLASGRELWNTYGPTEATVVTTATRLQPGRPVTIGRPLEGWLTAVVDDDGAPVALGEAGELAIAGVGLGRYLDPLLDSERFAALPALGWERAYRTGDLVRDTAHGIEFLGRRDDQVKLGGRRVELGEVAAHLCSAPGVRAAAAVVRKAEGGADVLVGYVAGAVDAAQVREHLAARLPAGLAPLIVPLPELPATAAGKVDRGALPWPPPQAATGPALGGLEAWLAERWAEQLGPQPVAPGSDFFELGGSSVAAAKLVSVLRRRFPAVTVADVYSYRRLGELAGRLEALGEQRASVAAPASAPVRRFGAVQIAGVLLLLALTAPGWLVGVFAYNDWQGAGPRLAWPLLAAGWVLFLSSPGRALLVVAARRILLRDLRPGRYPRRGWLACRLWFVERLGELFHLNHLAGTPWAARVARLGGAEVGEGARLGALPSAGALIRIGAGATIEPGVDADGWWIEGDELVIDELVIGAGARVGTRAVLMPGAVIGEGAEIEPGSVVSGPVPAAERWGGSPARHTGATAEDWPAGDPPAERRPRLWRWMYAAGLVAIDAVALVAAVPALGVLLLLGGRWQSLGGTVTALITAAPLLALAFIVSEALVVALAVRAVQRLVRPGWHADTGATAWALWLGEQLMETTRASLFPLYATVYTRAWLRLHGMPVGRRTEVSTAEGLNRLTRLGEKSFVADAPMFASARGHRGWLHVAPIEVGDRTFIGNGAIVSGGARVGSDSLVGIESNAPAVCADGSSWFGCPPIELPRVPDRPDPRRTTDPPRRLVLARGATEVVRILLPTTASIVLGSLVFLALDATGRAAGVAGIVAVTPFAIAAAGVCATLLTVALKWLLMGRYRPSEHPLWSSFVWRDEIVNSCQEQLSGEWLMNKALGTPLMTPYLRVLGARVGRDVWCETLAITEFDVVTIGDGCAVNRGACLETHLFHDRLMRIGPAELCPGSTLGPVSAALPDTRLGAGCVVGGRSVVMRGEELPAGTRWHGAPVVPM